MTVPARRAKARASAEFDDDFEDDFAPGEFYSGERVCPAPERLGGNALLRWLVVLVIAVGGGWVLVSYPDAWRGWLATRLAAVSSAIDQRAPAPIAAAAVAPPLPPPVTVSTPPQAAVVAPPPAPPPEQTPASDAEKESEVTTAAITPAAEEPAPRPLPPPVVNPADPYQKRAAAAGLHPDLSRVLLVRLSPTDYRNAAIAIETAVAKTPDTGVFVWPRQRKPELALFRVHFVPGAAPTCRRYVVTVTKDGWSTTAPPMEKCGARLAARKNK